MKGSEKQVAWANEILSGFMLEWNVHSAAAVATLEGRVEKYQSAGKDRAAAFAREDLEAVTSAIAVLDELDSAEAVLDNRAGVFNLGAIAVQNSVVDIIALSKKIIEKL